MANLLIYRKCMVLVARAIFWKLAILDWFVKFQCIIFSIFILFFNFYGLRLLIWRICLQLLLFTPSKGIFFCVKFQKAEKYWTVKMCCEV